MVLRSELDEQMLMISERLEQAGQQLPPSNVLRQQVLERLVLQELQMQRAERVGIKVSDEMLNSALPTSPSATTSRSATCRAALEAQGIDYRSYREEVRREMTLQMLRQRDVLARINVSPREIDQFLERQKNCAGRRREYNSRTS